MTVASFSSDWALVAACLYHSGELAGKLSASEQETVRRAADGFGLVTGLDSESLDLLWDWSHVRDSSDKAIGRMAYLCRHFLSA